MDNELFGWVLFTYLIMVGYIIYLHSRVEKYYKAGQVLSMVLHDIIHNDVEIRKTNDGIEVKRRTAE